jgi:hypothetical protein
VARVRATEERLTAIGVAELPFDIPVQVEATVRVD